MSTSIGYPVVAMSFQLKHQLTHVIRQRQQRYVSEENMKCFDILCKALPFDEEEGSEDGSKLSDEGSGHQEKIKNHIKSVVTKKETIKGFSLNNKTQTIKSNGNKTTSLVGGASKRDSSPSSKSSDSKISSSGSSSPLLPWKQEVAVIPLEILDTTVSINGDIPRPSSANKLNAPQKKQALVKAVPRTDLQQQIEAREKVCLDSLNLLVH